MSVGASGSPALATTLALASGHQPCTLHHRPLQWTKGLHSAPQFITLHQNVLPSTELARPECTTLHQSTPQYTQLCFGQHSLAHFRLGFCARQHLFQGHQSSAPHTPMPLVDFLWRNNPHLLQLDRSSCFKLAHFVIFACIESFLYRSSEERDCI